jgi:hypothetical protein
MMREKPPVTCSVLSKFVSRSVFHEKTFNYPNLIPGTDEDDSRSGGFPCAISARK